MYNSVNCVKTIRAVMKDKNISAAKMQADLSMGINALYQFEKGRILNSFKLAEIADYLDVSVDYLLGRTEKPEVNR